MAANYGCCSGIRVHHEDGFVVRRRWWASGRSTALNLLSATATAIGSASLGSRCAPDETARHKGNDLCVQVRELRRQPPRFTLR